jgi:hypothetical protein
MNANKRGKISRFSFVLIAILLQGLFSNAYGNLGMKPQIKELKVSRGGLSEFNFTITNHGNEPYMLLMLTEDMDMDADGQSFKADPEYKRGCASWISFSEESFTLDPGQSKEIVTRVRVPKDATGSYFSIVRCMLADEKTIELGKSQKSVSALGLSIGVGAYVFVTVSSSLNNISIQPDSISIYPGERGAKGPLARNSQDQSFWKIQVSVRNNGNIYTQAFGEVSIYTKGGRIVEKTSLTAGRGYIFPERTRIFTATGSKALDDGAYLAKVNFASKDGKTGRGLFPFSIVNGVAHLGTESEEILSLAKASSPGFSVSERYINIDVMPNAHRTKGISIFNNKKDTLVVYPKVIEWITDKKGVITFYDIGDTNCERSCAKWLTITPDSVVIPPNVKKDIRITLNAPPQMDGEYYAGIRFNTKDIKEDLPIEFLLPSSLLLATSDKRTIRNIGAIIEINKKKLDRNGCIFEVKFENKGNTHCFADGEIEIYGPDDAKIGEPIKFGSRDEFIFPGVIRTYEVALQETLSKGFYRAYVKISYAEKTKSLVENFSFQID